MPRIVAAARSSDSLTAGNSSTVQRGGFPREPASPRVAVTSAISARASAYRRDRPAATKRSSSGCANTSRMLGGTRKGCYCVETTCSVRPYFSSFNSGCCPSGSGYVDVQQHGHGVVPAHDPHEIHDAALAEHRLRGVERRVAHLRGVEEF